MAVLPRNKAVKEVFFSRAGGSGGEGGIGTAGNTN